MAPGEWIRRYQAVIKVDREDSPERRARDIEEGIAYACDLLMDEYDRSADEIAALLDGLKDVAYAMEARRTGNA